ncbi:MAG: TIGR02281 family clan AA aspartic protease [Sphingomonas sp.]
MSGGDQALSFVYLVLILVMVVSSLLVRRLPLGHTLKLMLAWILIFAAVFAIFALRNDFMALGRRLIGEATGTAGQETRGETLRIRRSDDGHFWVDAEVNGRPVRFMIDSGATVTTLAASAAASAGVERAGGFGVMVDTANGTVVMDRGRIDRLRLGPIQRESVAIHIAPNSMVNVIGMNFLSGLSGWSVEGDTLVLRP